MATTTRFRSDSQARFVAGVLLGALLFALGSAMFLFSLSTPSLVTTLDRVLATGVSVLLLLAGGALAVSTLR